MYTNNNVCCIPDTANTHVYTLYMYIYTLYMQVYTMYIHYTCMYIHYTCMYIHCTSIFNADSSASNLCIHSLPSLDNIDSSDVDMYIPCKNNKTN